MKIVFTTIRHQLLFWFMLLSIGTKATGLNESITSEVTGSMCVNMNSIFPHQNPLKQEQIISWLETQKNEKIPRRNETIEKTHQVSRF